MWDDEIKKILNNQNNKQIKLVYEEMFANIENIDIFFWIGSGFVNYIFGNDDNTWDRFFSKDYWPIKTNDFFTLTQVEFDYPLCINKINEKLDKNIKHYAFRDFINSLHDSLRSISGNATQLYGNSSINFISTNHCESVNKYFNINNIYFLDSMTNKLNINTKYNCFYIHTKDKKEGNWIYKIEHYHEFLIKNKLNDILIFFKNQFKKTKIIFCFGSSLSEVHLVSMLSKFMKNSPTLLINFKKIDLIEINGKEDSHNADANFINNFSDSLKRLNNIVFEQSRIINIYVREYEDYNEVWKEFTNEFKCFTDSLSIMQKKLLILNKTHDEYISDNMNRIKSMIKSYSKINLLLWNYDINNDFKMLQKIWNDFKWYKTIFIWFMKNLINKENTPSVKGLVNQKDIISIVRYFMSNKNYSKDIFNEFEKFININEIKLLEINGNEYEIIQFLTIFSRLKSITTNILNLCINTLIQILWNAYSPNLFILHFSNEYKEIINNFIENFNEDKFNIKDIIKEIFNSLNHEIWIDHKRFFLFNFINNSNSEIIDLEFIINLYKKNSIEELLYLSRIKEASIYFGKYFEKNVWKLEDLKKSSNYEEQLLLIINTNSKLVNDNEDYINLLKNKNINCNYDYIHKIYVRNYNDDDLFLINNWSSGGDIKKVLERILIPKQFDYEKEDALLLFFNKINKDSNNRVKDINNFLSIIVKNDNFSKIVDTYSSFPSIVRAIYIILLECLNSNEQDDNELKNGEYEKLFLNLNKFEKYESFYYEGISLYNISDLCNTLKFAYKFKSKILIKSIFNTFIVEEKISIFNLNIASSKNEYTLFDILKKLYMQNILKDILGFLLNVIDSEDIISICSNDCDDKLILLKLIYENKNLDHAKEKFSNNSKNIELTLKYFDDKSTNMINGSNCINWNYCNFLRMVYRIFGKNRFLSIFMSKRNFEFFIRIKHIDSFFIQLLHIVKDFEYLNDYYEFINTYADKIIELYYENIEYIVINEFEKILSFIIFLDNAINSKILDKILIDIENYFNKYSWFMYDNQKHRREEIQAYLWLAILIYKKIKNKKSIEHSDIFKFLSKNESLIKFQKEDLEKLLVKLVSHYKN